MFREIGADITFLEAPIDENEMRRYCSEVDGPKMANLIEGGKTPILGLSQLEAIGYKIAVFPLTLLNVSIHAMRTLPSLAAQFLITVLELGIRYQGASIDTYRSVDGQPGSMQERFAVYDREGEPCLRCGRPIRKIRVAQRGTHCCPNCTPRP